MANSGARTVLHAFLILAFILAGVSPACKFISGQMSVMEICGFDGPKLVVVDSTQIPDQDPHKKLAMDDCAFCFAQGTQKATGITVVHFWIPSDNALTLAAMDAAVRIGNESAQPFEARGPPAIL